MPSPVLGFQARFEAKNQGDSFTVSVDDGPSCQVPCELSVPPGRHQVSVGGDAKFRENVDFPAGPSTVKLEKRSGGRLALGIVGVTIGPTVAKVGGAVALLGIVLDVQGWGTPENRPITYTSLGIFAAGVALTVVGGVVGFGGAGHNRASIESASADASDHVAPVRLVSLGAAPTKDGAMMGATFSF